MQADSQSNKDLSDKSLSLYQDITPEGGRRGERERERERELIR
jgi:hypothetical protein